MLMKYFQSLSVLFAFAFASANAFAQEEAPENSALVVEQTITNQSDKFVTKVLVAETQAQLESALHYAKKEIANLKSLSPNFELDVVAFDSSANITAPVVAAVNEQASANVSAESWKEYGFEVRTSNQLTAGAELVPLARELAAGTTNAGVYHAELPERAPSSGISPALRWTLSITAGIASGGVRVAALIYKGGADPLSALVVGGIIGAADLGIQFFRTQYVKWVNDAGYLSVTGKPSGNIKPMFKRLVIGMMFTITAQSTSLLLGIPIVPVTMLEIALRSGKYMIAGVPWSNAMRNLGKQNEANPSRFRSVLIHTLPFGLGMLSAATATFDLMGVKAVTDISLGFTIASGSVAWLWTAENSKFAQWAKSFTAGTCTGIGRVWAAAGGFLGR